MITGIPQYQSPVEQSMRCLCGVLYVVLMRDGIGDVEARAQARAERIKATFVDARSTPFLQCECGEVMTIVEEVSAMRM